MPLIYKCKGCGHVLYDSSKHEQYDLPPWYGLPSPSEVARMYGGWCPKCWRPLGKPGLEDVKVKKRWVER